jgi:hypothetical protein
MSQVYPESYLQIRFMSKVKSVHSRWLCVTLGKTSLSPTCNGRPDIGYLRLDRFTLFAQGLLLTLFLLEA